MSFTPRQIRANRYPDTIGLAETTAALVATDRLLHTWTVIDAQSDWRDCPVCKVAEEPSREADAVSVAGGEPTDLPGTPLLGT